MPIAYESSASTAQSVAQTFITVAKPSGVVAGETIKATIQTNGSYGTLTLPTDWFTIINNVDIINPRSIAAYKVCGGSEPVDYTFSWTNSITSGGIIARYSGVDNTTPLDCTPVKSSGTATTTPVLTGVTTVTDGAMIITGIGPNSSSTTTTPPATLTERAEVAGKRAEHASAIQAVAGASGNFTFTFSASREYSGWVCALRPAASIFDGTASVAAGGTFSANGVQIQEGTATVSATSTFTAEGAVVVDGTATIAAVGTFSAEGSLTLEGTASVAAVGTFNADGVQIQEGTASIAALGTFTADGNIEIDGTASVAALVTFSADGVQIHEGTASVSSSATFSAEGTQIQVGTATVAAVVTFTAEGHQIHAGSSTVSAMPAFTAEGVQIQQGINPTVEEEEEDDEASYALELSFYHTYRVSVAAAASYALELSFYHTYRVSVARHDTYTIQLRAYDTHQIEIKDVTT